MIHTDRCSVPTVRASSDARVRDAARSVMTHARKRRPGPGDLIVCRKCTFRGVYTASLFTHDGIIGAGEMCIIIAIVPHHTRPHWPVLIIAMSSRGLCHAIVAQHITAFFQRKHATPTAC